MRAPRQTRRWATTSIVRRFKDGMSMEDVARTAYAPCGRPHPTDWLTTGPGQRARADVEDIIRRWMRRWDRRRT